MEFLTLVIIGFAGTLFWFLNTEATAIYYGATLGWAPMAVGVTCALGQVIMYVVLFYAGGRLVARWRWLNGRVERARTRFDRQLRRAYVPTTGVASLFGIPPVVALMTLASSFGQRLRSVLPVAFLGRSVRFAVLAAFGATIVGWWQ